MSFDFPGPILAISTSDQLDIFGRIFLALALGALVGAEREYRGHEAGIRTTALVCAGAAFFGEVSEGFGDSRIAAGVVQGIGFLCGGLIFMRGHNVRGVTTSATIWVVAGIGLGVASGLWLASTLMAVALFILLELQPLSDALFNLGHSRGAHVRKLSDDRPPRAPVPPESDAGRGNT